MEPIRRLTRGDVEFAWTEEQEEALSSDKETSHDYHDSELLRPQGRANRSVWRKSKGFRAALLQGGRPIAYASRALTETEQLYAQVEREMLENVYSFKKFNQYTYGRHNKIHSDHKPL